MDKEADKADGKKKKKGARAVCVCGSSLTTAKSRQEKRTGTAVGAGRLAHHPSSACAVRYDATSNVASPFLCAHHLLVASRHCAAGPV